MPALPWTQRQPLDPTARYVAMASRLPLRRHRAVPGFLRDTLRIRRQLAEAPGLVAYGLKADLLHKTFWTFSVWEDQAAIDAFARADPHRQIIRRLVPHMGRSRFATFAVDGDAVPTTWAEMTAPLADVAEPAEPTEPAEATEPTVAADPTEPADATEAAEPTVAP